MATGTFDQTSTRSSSTTAASPAFLLLKMMGSLKITVTMFILAMIIVLVGTLAQDTMDLAQVKRAFFTCWIASIPFDVFFPSTLFPHETPWFGGIGFYFPGGATIGLILLVNLIAAKATRFSVSAKGTKLVSGIVISALGGLLITAVILSGHTIEGMQGQPPISYDTLWMLLQAGMAFLATALVVYAFVAKVPSLVKWVLWIAASLAVALAATVILGSDAARMTNPGMRIVWQLLQSTIASAVLLVGLLMIFGKRGGNVLIHIGVGLLMVGQFVFGDRQIEQRIGLAEGKSTNLIFIEDELEIALVDPSDPEVDTVHTIPEKLIIQAERSGDPIDDPALPCKIRIVDWMKNSGLVPAMGEKKNPATHGFGLQRLAIERKTIGGAVMNERNMGSAYIELIDKESDKSLGVYLLAQEKNDQAQLYSGMIDDEYEVAEIGDTQWELALRFKQIHKSYDVLLKDVERVNYTGTERPRDYSSRLVITDRETGNTLEGKTWMNNPIRFQGETFYQSRYNQFPDPSDPSGNSIVETTGLQVVQNAGWVIPYVSCMIVFVGMFAHFGGTFLVFANRYSRPVSPYRKALTEASADNKKKKSQEVPATLSHLKHPVLAATGFGIVTLFAVALAIPRGSSSEDIDWQTIGKLPMQHEGRIKPMDTVARNVLQVIGEPIFGFTPRPVDAEGESRKPVEWLLGLMTNQPWVNDAAIIRIYSQEVRGFFNLEDRKNFRYSLSELEDRMDDFRQQEISKLIDREPSTFNNREQHVAKLATKLNLIDLIRYSYLPPPLPRRFDETASDEEKQAYFSRLIELSRGSQRMTKGDPPALFPPEGKATKKGLIDADWQTVNSEIISLVISRELGEDREPLPTVSPFFSLAEALGTDNSEDVNKAVYALTNKMEEAPLAAHYLSKTSAESWLNRFNPTMQAVAFYLVALVISAGGFMFRARRLHTMAFWMLVAVLIVHTVVILTRIYITGKSPVVNLYSSAIFIGWACVLASLVIETLFPMGFANIIGGLIGVATVSIARALDTSDTMHQLEAVLDTQFWLSTHVITVTLGYAATFLAGFVAIILLGYRMATSLGVKVESDADASINKILASATYGCVCFALFFSFIGTVLGGLWADDSWGRFWGWDPKENGALLIVLWNAVLLHARWDKMVGPRGFALLAVLGNIVTAWSWFGTNLLGIGLHSYGFQKGTLVALTCFALFNLVFVGVAWALTRAGNNQAAAE